MRVRTQNVLFIDCEGNNFDSLPGRLLNAGEHHLSTDDVVKTLKGKHDAVWFENITDSVHITMEEPTDVVFVYSPRHMAFAITGESPADLMCDSVVVK